MHNYDVIVVGTGFAGAISARMLAENGKNVLVLEQRDHIAGNAYDCPDDSGIVIHKYGPHIFHTNDKEVFDFLLRFTEWRKYEHRVSAKVNGVYMPVPFNLTSLEIAFGERAKQIAQKLIKEYGMESKVSILELRKNSDPEIAELAEYVYNNVFAYYTQKQWGLKPEQIDPATTARVPVFISYDDRYFQDEYQGLPKHGFTQMFYNMLDHPNITLKLETYAKDHIALVDGKIMFNNNPFNGKLIYTGPLDELFGYCYGRLPYRTLDFDFETFPMDQFQDYGTINYTTDELYTRITEFKYLTGQQNDNLTTIMKEYSREYTGKPSEIPYYPIISEENTGLYNKYSSLASNFDGLYLLGRLAEYRYYNMDAVAAQTIKFCKQLGDK